MTAGSQTTEALMERLFKRPTAPFREHSVRDECVRIATEARRPFFMDSFGNLFVGVQSAKELAKGSRLLLFAHMDHPGFLISTQTEPTKASGVWMGGGPFAQTLGSKIRLYDPNTGRTLTQGKVEAFENGPYKVEGLKITIGWTKPLQLPPGTFGAFAQPELKRRGHQIVSRVADDLAGVVMALGAVLDDRKSGRTVAVLTRAEEVGLVGCLALLKKIKISPQSICVSLEASRELPGAKLGEGPVLRLGDRATLFDNLSSQFMLLCAQELQKEQGLKFQRRIMDGGRCEASAMSLYGLRTTGLAVPLRNYHNQGKRGPAPEIIDFRDMETGRKILSRMALQLKDFGKLEQKMRKQLDVAFSKLVPQLLEKQKRPKKNRRG